MCSTLAKSKYVLVYIRAIMALSIFSVIGRACTIIVFSRAEISYKFFNLAHQCLPSFGRVVLVHA